MTPAGVQRVMNPQTPCARAGSWSGGLSTCIRCRRRGGSLRRSPVRGASPEPRRPRFRRPAWAEGVRSVPTRRQWCPRGGGVGGSSSPGVIRKWGWWTRSGPGPPTPLCGQAVAMRSRVDSMELSWATLCLNHLSPGVRGGVRCDGAGDEPSLPSRRLRWLPPDVRPRSAAHFRAGAFTLQGFSLTRTVCHGETRRPARLVEGAWWRRARTSAASTPRTGRSANTDIHLSSVGRGGRTVTYVRWGRMGDGRKPW